MQRSASVPFKLILLLFFLVSCTSSFEMEYERGVQARNEKNFKEAVTHFRRVIQRGPESGLARQAASQAADISYQDLKNYQEALRYYKFLVIHQQNLLESIEAQKKIIEIVTTHLNDYQQAVTEISRILEQPLKPDEKKKYRLELSRSYFYTNNFFQSKVEAERLINRQDPKDPNNFDPMQMLANIALAEKKIEDAVSIYLKLIEYFPERSIKEQIVLNLAVCYEELKDYDKATAALEKALPSYPQPDFLKIRIQRLKQRKANLPGAQGLKK